MTNSERRTAVRPTYFKRHRHLWPLHAMWSLVRLGALIASLFAVGAFVFGYESTYLFPGSVFAALSAAMAITFFGILPAAVLTILDTLLIDRSSEPPAPPHFRARRADRQNLYRWAVIGAFAGTSFAAAYSVVYLNAFADTTSLVGLWTVSLTRAAVGAVLVALFVAWVLDLAQKLAPTTSVTTQMIRGAAAWATAVLGLGAVRQLLLEPALETNLLPVALFALLGAFVVPQAAMTPPTDPSKIPPPQVPSAPSPGPSPEGGSREGARGDWRTAPPPRISDSHQTTRSNRDSIPTPMEVVNG